MTSGIDQTQHAPAYGDEPPPDPLAIRHRPLYRAALAFCGPALVFGLTFALRGADVYREIRIGLLALGAVCAVGAVCAFVAGLAVRLDGQQFLSLRCSVMRAIDQAVESRAADIQAVRDDLDAACARMGGVVQDAIAEAEANTQQAWWRGYAQGARDQADQPANGNGKVVRLPHQS